MLGHHRIRELISVLKVGYTDFWNVKQATTYCITLYIEKLSMTLSHPISPVCVFFLSTGLQGRRNRYVRWDGGSYRFRHCGFSRSFLWRQQKRKGEQTVNNALSKFTGLITCPPAKHFYTNSGAATHNCHVMRLMRVRVKVYDQFVG